MKIATADRTVAAETKRNNHQSNKREAKVSLFYLGCPIRVSIRYAVIDDEIFGGRFKMNFLEHPLGFLGFGNAAAPFPSFLRIFNRSKQGHEN
ncbi:hypothetical protein [Flavobacterium sp.]|uniref:hypothetical protein n=1 Tax=Flavobacterium sp. TaxID=239 RepID=UPI0039E56306